MNSDSSPLAMSRRYAMFISYRHADNLEMGRKWATWLHEAVEGYEVPADLVGRMNLRGEAVPATLYPVFRDEEELPADADLSSNIERALENSGLLVVICSPRAVQSRFVADEIRHFKELGKCGRILALIIDGEPNASDDPEKAARLGSAAECFPEPLRFGVPVDGGGVDWSRRTEPIAADCRPGGRAVQGWTTAAAYQDWLESQGNLGRAEKSLLVSEYAERLELAKLKVIAGALGLPLGELTQRDKARQLLRAKRKARILTTLSTLFALLAGTAGVLGWWAHEKRNEAEAQRREANAQRIEADSQRLLAETQRQAADTARADAEAGRKQAVSALAASDFQEGVNRLADPKTARAGLAFLARSARAGNPDAADRIWTLYQQQPFWLPEKVDTLPEVRAVRKVASPIPTALEKVAFEAAKVAPTWHAQSADGSRRVTVLSLAEAGEGPIAFRFWDKAGSPVGPWHRIDYTGDNYLAGIPAAVLSDDGRFAAIVCQPWRAPQFVEIWDVARGRRIGNPLEAGGGHPNEQGAAFHDLWFSPAVADTGVQHLVTMSNRGDACVHRVDASVEDGELWTVATHRHDQAVIHAVLDPACAWFASAAVDQSVIVSGLTEGMAPAWPIHAPGMVEGMSIDAPDRVTLRHDGGGSSWRLSRPPAAPVPAGAALVQTNDKSLLKSWDEPSDPVTAPIIADRRGSLELRIVDGAELALFDSASPGSPPSWRRRFPAAIAHARFRDEDSIVVQTAFFTTLIWNLAKDAPEHPLIDESTLFSADSRSDTVLLSSLCTDGRRVLTRSFFWDPPNVGIHAFTVWDAATGKPLCSPLRFVDNVALDTVAVNHAEFSPDDLHLFLGRAGEGGKPEVMSVLQLHPPAGVRAIIADLAEALGGFRLGQDSGIEAVASRTDELLKKTAAALAGASD